jgi:hypothetical protein
MKRNEKRRSPCGLNEPVEQMQSVGTLTAATAKARKPNTVQLGASHSHLIS